VSASSIQIYDLLMIAVILVTTVHGARKGMAWQLAALASLIVSAIVAVRFSPALAPHVGSDPQWNRYTAMLILYLGTSLGIWVVFRLVSGIIDRVKLQGLDRQIGGLFGFAKGILLCLVVTFFAVTLSEWARQNILKTYSGHYIAVLLHKGTPLLPDEVRGVLGKYIQELEVKLAIDGPPSPDLSPDTTLPDLLKRELAPKVAPAPRSPAPASRPAANQPPTATPVSMPNVSGPQPFDPQESQPPRIPSEALQPTGPASSRAAPAYPPPYAPPTAQPPAYSPRPQQPGYRDEPVPKGMQRVP
jgi:membrane protein required for colicin V production